MDGKFQCILPLCVFIELGYVEGNLFVVKYSLYTGEWFEQEEATLHKGQGENSSYGEKVGNRKEIAKIC